jgi:hypothetical protein
MFVQCLDVHGQFPVLYVEEYIRRWTQSEKEELDTLSEWTKSIRKS